MQTKKNSFFYSLVHRWCAGKQRMSLLNNTDTNLFIIFSVKRKFIFNLKILSNGLMSIRGQIGYDFDLANQN